MSLNNGSDNRLETSTNSESKAWQQIPIFKFEDPLGVLGAAAEEYPEMKKLTEGTLATPEGKNQQVETLGQQIFPDLSAEELIEFNRTGVGILVLKWILSGDYDSFTACQPQEKKLSQDSFEKIEKIH